MKTLIFDSGLGGAYLAKDLNEKIHGLEIILIMDKLYFPYGTKEPSVIYSRLTALSKVIKELDIDLLVIACNTASAVYLSQPINFGINTLEITKITSDYILQNISKGTTLLLATENTIKSKVYQLNLEDSNRKVLPHVSTALIDLIENSFLDVHFNTKFDSLIDEIPSQKFQSIVLGCTHFSHVYHKFVERFQDVTIIDSIKPIRLEIERNKSSFQNSPKSIKIYSTLVNEELVKIIDGLMNIKKIERIVF